jgi:hypothetical protein
MNRKFLYLRSLTLSNTIIFCFCVISVLSLIHPLYGKGTEPEEVLSTSVQVSVDWDIDQGNTTNKGHMTFNINGCMQLDRTHTKEVKGKSFYPFPIYNPQSMVVQYTYAESLVEKSKGMCPPLVAEYIGNGTFMLSGDPNSRARAQLYIRRLTTMMPGIEQMELLKDIPGIPDPGSFCDYYEFFAGGPGVTIPGRIRGSDCHYESTEKDLSICKLALRFQIPDDGKMRGEREWSTKTQTGAPPLKMTLSDLPASMNQAPYDPENVPGDVTYRVTWSFGETDVALLRIKRNVNGNWEDVEDNEELKNVIVGEKVELRGVVYPEEKDPKRGEWVVDGNSNENYIKKFKVAEDHTQSEVIPLQGEDLRQSEIRFYWFKGKEGTVTYTTTVDGEEYSQDVSFTIRKPEYEVAWDSRDANHFGVTTGGDPELRDQWPDSNRVDPGYGGELGERDIIEGLEYNGILFCCESGSDIPGNTQWVQLIENCQFIRWDENGVTFVTPPIEKNCETGLDMVYPCAVNNSFYDAPAIPTSVFPDNYSLFRVTMSFDLYLMFKPRGEENEWVPLKKIDWKWAGGVEKVNDKWEPRGVFSFVPYMKEIAIEGEEPTDTDATEYPLWGKIVDK